MSIRIERDKCLGCARCTEACPGNLIKMDAAQKARIRRVRDCWGCTACMKECQAGAIVFFLGADMGGRGGTLSVSLSGDISRWKVTARDGTVRTVEVDKNRANQY